MKSVPKVESFFVPRRLYPLTLCLLASHKMNILNYILNAMDIVWITIIKTESRERLMNIQRRQKKCVGVQKKEQLVEG
jgi:hypothetical protein